MATTPRKERDAAARDGRAIEGRGASRVSATRASISRHQVDDLRSRITSGVYDDPHVIEAAARRILASGDL